MPLADWRDFYVTIGTASGAILGASFIVATLAAGLKERITGLRGFVSPTAFHLATVLVGSAILTIPTLTSLSLAILLGTSGLGGTIYGLVVAARIWTLRLDPADRACYVFLPILAYAALVAAAVIVHWAVTAALDTLAAAFVVILVVGVRNAWDMATFMIARERE